ncbi:hypothetical protein D9M68_805090 [compost metagenome]
MNLTAPSTARVPETEYSTRVRRPGAMWTSLSTRSKAAVLGIHPLICMPWQDQARSIAPLTEGGVGPNGDAPQAER